MTTATANAQTIERFYEAFSRLDARAMAACYASDAAFDDEAFCCAAGNRWAACGGCSATPRAPRAPTSGG